MLPREFGRLERRSLVSREALLATGLIAIVIVVGTGIFAGDDPAFLASAYSFGVLFAFTAAQLAVIRLRRKEPDLERPFRAKPEVRIRGVLLPAAGADRRAAHVLRLGARADHPPRCPVCRPGLAPRRARRLLPRAPTPRGRCARRHRPRRGRSRRAPSYRKVLVPMKLGDIGEEMVATAIALAKERGATVEAVFVVRVPRAFPLEGALPEDVQRRAEESLAEARVLGEENGVEVVGHTIVRPLDRPCDRRRGDGARRRPDRARVVAAMAAPVAVLLADRRPRASLCTMRGARRRVPRRNVRVAVRLLVVKAVIIGCGRVGSAVAKELAREGWDVTCVDENEDALSRLGAWKGGFVVGHGMDREHPRAGRAPPRRRRRSSRPTATTRTS